MSKKWEAKEAEGTVRNKVLLLPGIYYEKMMSTLFEAIIDNRGAETIEEQYDLQEEINDLMEEALGPFFERISEWVQSELEVILLSFMAGMSALSTGVQRFEEIKFMVDLEEMDFVEEDDENGEQQDEGQEG